jgi:hypothetical protein
MILLCKITKKSGINSIFQIPPTALIRKPKQKPFFKPLFMFGLVLALWLFIPLNSIKAKKQDS